MANILDAPTRGGFVRRRVREDEMDHILDAGWARVENKEGDKFKATLSDAVGNGGSPGRLFLVEIPEEDYHKYQYNHQGGRLNELQNASLKGSKNFDDKEKGGEKVSTQEGLPPQAKLRRPNR